MAERERERERKKKRKKKRKKANVVVKKMNEEGTRLNDQPCFGPRKEEKREKENE